MGWDSLSHLIPTMCVQTKQRALLALAHEKVQHHDEIRCSALHEVLDAALKCYRHAFCKPQSPAIAASLYGCTQHCEVMSFILREGSKNTMSPKPE